MPALRCPQCGSETEADFVDIGVGLQQTGPYGCFNCGWVQDGVQDEPDTATTDGLKFRADAFEIVGAALEEAYQHAAKDPHECDENCRCCGTCYRESRLEICSRKCKHAPDWEKL